MRSCVRCTQNESTAQSTVFVCLCPLAMLLCVQAVFCTGSFFGQDGSVDALWASLQDRSVAGSHQCPFHVSVIVSDMASVPMSLLVSVPVPMSVPVSVCVHVSCFDFPHQELTPLEILLVASNAIVARQTAVPCPTFIMGPVTEAQKKYYEQVPLGGELVPNLSFIGRPA